MSDLVLKEIYGKCKRENIKKNETKKYKMTDWEIFEKYHNIKIKIKINSIKKTIKKFMPEMML